MDMLLDKHLKGKTIEESVLNVCQEVLKIDKKILEEKYFDKSIPLDSLDHLEINYRLSNIYNIELDEEEFGKLNTIENMVTYIIINKK